MLTTANYIGIINTLDGVQKKYKKGYCYPSHDTILNLLKKFHQDTISLRTLCRRLAWLEDNGYIKRVRRIRLLPTGILSVQSTIYMLKKKAYVLVGRVLRKLSHFKKGSSNWLIQKESPSISVEVPGPDEDRLLTREEVLALTRGLLKTMD